MILQSFNNYNRFEDRDVFFKVLMIIKELNLLFEIDKMCQSVIMKSLMFKIHMKLDEEESNNILQMYKRIYIKLIHD